MLPTIFKRETSPTILAKGAPLIRCAIKLHQGLDGFTHDRQKRSLWHLGVVLFIVNSTTHIGPNGKVSEQTYKADRQDKHTGWCTSSTENVRKCEGYFAVKSGWGNVLRESTMSGKKRIV